MRKLKKNELEKIEPFNYAWIGSCFDHCVCSAMPYFGIDIRQFLLTRYQFYKDNLSFESIVARSSEGIYAEFGLKVKNAYWDNIEDVINLIDSGIPVIAGIDCFWIKHRIDKYQRVHANHFILVYGYDRKKKHFIVVEHGYINSSHFQRMLLPFADFTKGNKSFFEYFGHDDSSGKIIEKVKSFDEKIHYEKTFLKRKDVFEKSIAAALKNFSTVIDICNKEFNDFIVHYSKLCEFFNQSIMSRKILLFSLSILSVPNLTDLLEKLLIDLQYVISIIGKINYSKDEQLFTAKKDMMISRLNDIIVQEEALHSMLIKKGEEL